MAGTSLLSNSPSDNNATISSSRSSGAPTMQSALAASFADFLTVSIHQILFLRDVYPRTTFLPVRAYNYPVRQSRHPRVCDYIRDVSIAVGTEILKGSSIRGVSVIISSVRSNRPLERYAFDLSSFPRVSPANEINTTTFFGTERMSSSASRGKSAAEQRQEENVDIESQFRACLARLASACARLTPLPSCEDDDFSFTVCIELWQDALPPAGTTSEEQAWIVAEPEKHSAQQHSNPPPSNNDKAKTVPVRRVEAGELRLEVWVEEARQKFEE